MEEYQEQHAIPQQISAYQFRLVGDMTLKQFFQLAGGALISLLLYSTTLPALIKWPLIIISFLIGVAMAFFPLQDRPLAKWFELFFKAIYSPTLYVWKKSPVTRLYFRAEDTKAQPIAVPEPQIQPIESPKSKDEPKTSSEKMISAQANLERTEVAFLSTVSQHLGPVKQQAAGSITFPGDETSDDLTTPEEKELKVPESKAVATEKKGLPKEDFEVTSEAKAAGSPSVTRTVAPFATQESAQAAQAATFALQASPPIPPTQPNIIVGQVLTADGKIIESAILEIKDSYGRPARALKTNKLGHFMIVTPLYDGKYEILIEKEGFEFDPISLEAKGEVLNPIAITAKAKINALEN